jgi:uncharacterized protein
MSSALQQGLSEAEIEQLAERLAANTNPGALSLEAVDGLFCALIAAPRLIGPTDYLPAVFGGEPDFRDLADAQDTMGLLLRYWNAIAHDFEHGTFHLIHLARLGEPDHDGVQGRAWARGYMCGIRLAREGWSRILRDEREELLRYVPLVAGEVDPDWPKKPLTEKESNSILTDMLAGAARAYRYFKEDRVAFAPASQRSPPHERVGPKIGRNDPCPCGGKKYKRCCGAAGADLH